MTWALKLLALLAVLSLIYASYLAIEAKTGHKSPLLLNICWTFSVMVWLVPYAGNIWTNALWKRGFKGFFGWHRLDWSQQIVLVTGGSSGIGRMIVDLLAGKKVTVVVLDVRPYQNQMGTVHYYKCDVSKRDEVFNVMNGVVKEVGQPTILINNAGVVTAKDILAQSEEEIRRTFDINTLAHFWTTQALLPSMIERNAGHIVTISSVLSHIGVAQISTYCASKAAITSFHESLRAELIHRYKAPNIRLTLVCPGTVSTPLFSGKAPPSRMEALLAGEVNPRALALKIIEGLDKEQSGTVYMPRYTRLMWVLRGMPDWVGDAARWVSGIDLAMRTMEKED